MAAKRVSIIDDDPIASMITARILELSRAEAAVRTYHSVNTFISALDEGEQPEIILLDINLPDIDGWSLLEQFGRKLPDGCRVFMLTSSIDNRDIERANNSPLVSGYLLKPLDEQGVSKLFSSGHS